MVSKTRRKRQNRKKAFERDGYICQICGTPTDPTDIDKEAGVHGKWYPTADHLKAVSLGGTNDLDNLITAHRWCNGVKKREELSFFPKTEDEIILHMIRFGDTRCQPIKRISNNIGIFKIDCHLSGLKAKVSYNKRTKKLIRIKEEE